MMIYPSNIKPIPESPTHDHDQSRLDSARLDSTRLEPVQPYSPCFFNSKHLPLAWLNPLVLTPYASAHTTSCRGILLLLLLLLFPSKSSTRKLFITHNQTWLDSSWLDISRLTFHVCRLTFATCTKPDFHCFTFQRLPSNVYLQNEALT